MADPTPEEITAFMLRHYSLQELSNIGKRVLRFFFPPFGDVIKVAPGGPPLPPRRGEVGSDVVDQPATAALCARLLLEKQMPCPELQLEDEPLRREVERRFEAVGAVLLLTEGCWRVYWMEAPPAKLK